MSHEYLINDPVLDLIPNNCGRVLDVACGMGEWGFFVKTRKNCSYLVGIDIWEPYLEKLRQLNIYDELIISRLPKLPKFDQLFDVILALEILEHLTKENGYKLLKNLEQLIKTGGIIIVSTPMNYPCETHISEWTPRELENLGYNVKKVHTLPKTLRLADELRRFILRLPKGPVYLIAIKLCAVKL